MDDRDSASPDALVVLADSCHVESGGRSPDAANASLTRRGLLRAIGGAAIGCCLRRRLRAETSRRPPVTALALAPGGEVLLAGSQEGVAMLAWPSRQLQRTLPFRAANVHALAFAADGRKLAVVGGDPGEQALLTILSWPELRVLRDLTFAADEATSACWSADGATLLVGLADHDLCLVAAEGDEAPATLTGHSKPVTAVARLQDHWLSAGRDATIRVWRGGELVRSLQQHTAAVLDLAVRPTADGEGDPRRSLAASASEDQTVRIWQPLIGRMVRFCQLPSAARRIIWERDGEGVLAACQDGRLRRIDAASVSVTATHEAVSGWCYALALDPAGDPLVGGENRQLAVVGGS